MRAERARIPWLFGAWADLLFGCGLLYALLFVTFLAFGAPLRSAQPSFLFPALILLLGVPHYGATLLRVYEQRRERQAFVIFSLWATLAIALVFVAALHNGALASVWLTLYLTWSPWHYTGQNYGLAVMFLRRAGVDLEPRTKRWLYASFLLSFLLVFLEMHARGATASDLPLGYASEQGGHFVPLGIPMELAAALIPAITTAYLSALVVIALRLRGRAPWRSLLPAGLLAVSQAVWFSAPYAMHLLGFASRLDPLDWRFRNHYFTWIALAHSLQYLWVTAYYARQATHWHGQTVQYAKALAAGAAPWTLPFLAFGPQALGPLSADAGLGMLVAATVNIHHFVLDGAIWKLRGRIADVLIRSRSEVDESAGVARRLSVRRAVWAVCVASLVLYGIRVANDELLRFDFDNGRVADARVVNERQARLGFDRGAARLMLGRALLEAGRPAEAREQILRSLELNPKPEAHFALGRSYEAERLWVRAAESYQAALDGGISGAHEEEAIGRAAGAWFEAGETARARAFLVRLDPNDPRFSHLFDAMREAPEAGKPSL